ncbi:hypothetical protein AAFF_G00323290 [Aldrovandia affinis]|uniref:Uncharacterized protein n=1 Tax=Aldrovandia affinis TaxID=143900 RepID=A0AAD7SMS0_9TELE|nr:hypothetical protein AAFF_G00323290 [Aldrovandia affinis]
MPLNDYPCSRIDGHVRRPGPVAPSLELQLNPPKSSFHISAENMMVIVLCVATFLLQLSLILMLLYKCWSNDLKIRQLDQGDFAKEKFISRGDQQCLTDVAMGDCGAKPCGTHTLPGPTSPGACCRSDEEDEYDPYSLHSPFNTRDLMPF